MCWGAVRVQWEGAVRVPSHRGPLQYFPEEGYCIRTGIGVDLYLGAVTWSRGRDTGAKQTNVN